MKLLQATSRMMFALALVVFFFGLVDQNSLAQTATVSVSPGDLSFGIPTGTTAPLTSTALVTVSTTGTGQATLSGFQVNGGNAGDFILPSNTNTCVTPQTAPTTCQIAVQFTSTEPAGVLETATLNFNSSTQDGPITVPLNGAYGAIELFSPININSSLINYVTWTQNPPTAGYSVQNTTINLSCPSSGVTATLSSTPDGSSNVFQDNTIQVANTVNGTTTTTTNVCYGGDTNFDGYNGFPPGTSNCFQASYESAVTNYVGQDPDLAFGLVGTYGIAPLNLQNPTNALYPAVLTSGNQALNVELTDAGGYLGAATLHLVTNCSLAGITPGGSITGNPIESNPTQNFTFDSAPGQNISAENSVAAAGGATFKPGIVPIFTDIAVPQQLFYQLVTNTSAAPAVCFRLTSELDYTVMPPAPMCKGFLVQCYNPGDGTTSGPNCDPTSSNVVRNLYNALKFSTPDGPVNGFNFLYGPVGDPAADACSNVVSGGSCANGTGPGILMGGDDWLCGAAKGSPCPAVANTTTRDDPPTYASSNCTLSGSLTGALCPLDLLTEFEGAADSRGGSTTDGNNSVLIPVVNMPLPTATVSIGGQNANGWIHGSSNITANFNSYAATYPTTGNIPPGNSFTAASPFTLTYGLSTWPNLPDTTYPVVGDLTMFNSNTNSAAPFCNIGGKVTPSTFASSGSFSQSDGIYNLHYFTTDCAFAEGLIFNPTGTQLTNATANWASFPYVTVGIDNVAPVLSSCSAPPAPVYNGLYIWYKANFAQSCTVTDTYSAGLYGSGFLPLLPNSIQGSPSETVAISTSAPANAVSMGIYATPVPANPTCDLAGNCVPVSAGPYNFDLQAPTIIGPTLSSPGPYYVNGPPVTVTFSCSDGTGSGIATCLGSGPTNSGGTINTSTPGTYTFTVTATDNVGNQSTASVTYTVSDAPSADVAVGDIPIELRIKAGSTGNYYPWVIDLSSAAANNVVATSTFTVPNNVLNGSLSGDFATVTCGKNGCNSGPPGGTSCSVNTTIGANTTVVVLTCNIGQLVSITKLEGVVITVNIPILSTAAPNTKFSSVTAVTSDNDPNLRNNSVTETYIVVTK